MPGSTGVQARLLQCLSGQVCLSGAAFYNDVDDLTVEVDPINNGLQVSLNGAAQAANIGLLSSSSFTFQYLSAFSIQVSEVVVTILRRPDVFLLFLPSHLLVESFGKCVCVCVLSLIHISEPTRR